MRIGSYVDERGIFAPWLVEAFDLGKSPISSHSSHSKRRKKTFLNLSKTFSHLHSPHPTNPAHLS